MSPGGQRGNLVLGPEFGGSVSVECCDAASLCGRVAVPAISCVGGARNTCASEEGASSAVEVGGVVEEIGPIVEEGVGRGENERRFLSLASAGVGICCLSQYCCGANCIKFLPKGVPFPGQRFDVCVPIRHSVDRLKCA